MKYKKTALKNGLRVITVPIPNLESATITIWVGVGSRYESDRISGLSHFLEHMVFKGSKKRPNAKLIAEAIDSFGGEFNASTSKEWTNFYIKSRVGKLETAMDVLSDMVLNPLLKSREIEKEKGVIVEEIAMYEDNPMAKIGNIYERLIFKGNPLGRDVIGNVETVRNVKRNDFIRYRDIHYGSNNIVVTISGGIDEKNTLRLVKKYFTSIKNKKKKEIKKFEQKQEKPKVLLHSKKIEQAHFILGFLGNRRGHKDRYAEAILASALGSGMSSRMFLEVREKRGLAYAVSTSSDHLIDTGYMSTYVGADIKRVDEAIKVVLDQHHKIVSGKNPITKGELKKAKEYIKGHLALSLEDTKDVNSFFGARELMLGKIETPNEVYKALDKVKINDCMRIASEFFVPERLNFAVIGPFKNKGRFERLLS
jgi:predicted Zn-dependent peptidase